MRGRHRNQTRWYLIRYKMAKWQSEELGVLGWLWEWFPDKYPLKIKRNGAVYEFERIVRSIYLNEGVSPWESVLAWFDSPIISQGAMM